jgi:uroporphyrinogen-III synthase
VPEQFTGEGVVAAFQGFELQGRQILFPRADGARDLIPQQLRNMGAVVVDPIVYRNIMPQSLPTEARQALEHQQLDVVIFSSPSTVRNLAALVGGALYLQKLLVGITVASIGPITSQACGELGLTVTLEPPLATLDDLVAELEQTYARR